MENDENTVDVQDEIKDEQTQEIQGDESNDVQFELEKAKADAAKWRRLAEKNKTTPKPITNDRESTKPSDILKADEFKLYREGYSEDQIDIIMANGGYKVIQDEKHPLTIGLKVAKEQRRAEEASSQASSTSGLSEIERKYTEQDMRNMKPEELEKIIGFAQ